MNECIKEWPDSAHVIKYVSKWISKDMYEWMKREREWWWKELKLVSVWINKYMYMEIKKWLMKNRGVSVDQQIILLLLFFSAGDGIQDLVYGR